MNQYKNLTLRLKEILDEEDILLDEEMKKHTYFKVGGPADILVTPKTIEQVVELVKFCTAQNIPFYIIGNGSNLLVKDGGFRGIIIKLSKLDAVSIENENIIAMGGAQLKDVSNYALENCLTGFEFACGIPGSIGGAVTMNAGAYDGEMVNVIESVLIMDKDCNVKRLVNEELELGYRTSAVMKHGYTVLEVTLKLKKGENHQIKEKIEDLTRKREEKQPLEYPSAGSTFKRPNGYFAGKLIQDSGLKGASVGGAAVSEKHSGFIINKNNATAKDILDLIEMVQKIVKENYGVELQPEVRIIGEE